jgi:hypothetical protein
VTNAKKIIPFPGLVDRLSKSYEVGYILAPVKNNFGQAEEKA